MGVSIVVSHYFNPVESGIRAAHACSWCYRVALYRLVIDALLRIRKRTSIVPCRHDKVADPRGNGDVSHYLDPGKCFGINTLLVSYPLYFAEHHHT